jgi:hypothetical protein
MKTNVSTVSRKYCNYNKRGDGGTKYALIGFGMQLNHFNFIL